MKVRRSLRATTHIIDSPLEKGATCLYSGLEIRAITFQLQSGALITIDAEEAKKINGEFARLNDGRPSP